MFEYITVNKDNLIGKIEFKTEFPIYSTKKVYLSEDGFERSLELDRLGKKSSDVSYEYPYDWRKPYITMQYKSGLDEDALKQADISSLKTVFTGYNSFVSKISQKATCISNAANRASATYTNNGTYSKTDSSLTSSKIDKEV